MMAAWGVQPQAQKTGTSPGLMSTGSPMSGLFTSAMPMRDGSPMWTGDPWTAGKRPVHRTALGTWAAGMGRMLTTMGPFRAPAGAHWILVMYMGTFRFCSMWRTGMPASSRAPSKEKEHPRRKPTRSSLQYFFTSVGSSTHSPFTHTLYRGRSVERSAPGATIFGSGFPGSVTSRMGQGFGFLWAKTRNS